MSALEAFLGALRSSFPPRCPECGRYKRKVTVSYFGGPRRTWRCPGERFHREGKRA